MPILLTLRRNSNCVAPSLSANARAESTIFLRIDVVDDVGNRLIDGVNERTHRVHRVPASGFARFEHHVGQVRRSSHSRLLSRQVLLLRAVRHDRAPKDGIQK